MKWSLVLAVALLLMVLAGVFNEGDVCRQPTEAAWVYCPAVRPVR